MTIKTALNGVKVVEWTQAGTGPWAGKCLADFGAEVIKIESANFPDFMRMSGPYKDNIPGLDRSPRFSVFNTSKKSFTLNLKDPRGIEIFKKLVAWADIVLQNQRPGSTRKMGLGYNELKKIKEDIIVLDISIVGQDGPLSGIGGWGNNSMGQSGQFYYFRNPGGEPLVAGFTATPDCVAPIYAAMVGVLAVDYKRKTGKGQYIDMCQLEVMTHFIGPAVLEYTANGRIQQPVGNRSPLAAPHNVYRCKGDDKWCVLAAFTDQEWRSLCDVMEMPQLCQSDKFKTGALRKQNEAELNTIIGNWTMKFTDRELMHNLQKVGIPAGIVQNAETIVTWDPQVKSRQLLFNRTHPIMGEFLHARWPFLMSKTPDVITPSPCLGEHNFQISTEILGMTNEEFIMNVNEGIIV